MKMIPSACLVLALALGSAAQASTTATTATTTKARVAAAQSSTTGVGYVTAVVAHWNGAVFFTYTGPRSGAPACHSNLSSQWVFQGGDAQGQIKLSLIMTAYTMHKPLTIWGKGVCDVFSDTETADVLFLN